MGGKSLSVGRGFRIWRRLNARSAHVTDVVWSVQLNQEPIWIVELERLFRIAVRILQIALLQLRARFVSVSPTYELGVADAGQYAQTLVALFSGIVWLSRDSLSAGHIRFFLKSPGDAQFFAPLKAATELSLFSEFTIGGALIECTLKEAELAETA